MGPSRVHDETTDRQKLRLPSIASVPDEYKEHSCEEIDIQDHEEPTPTKAHKKVLPYPE